MKTLALVNNRGETKRKSTFAHLAKKYEENQSEDYLQSSKRYFVKASWIISER